MVRVERRWQPLTPSLPPYAQMVEAVDEYEKLALSIRTTFTKENVGFTEEQVGVHQQERQPALPLL